ncbi:MAG: aldo/keto reductase [Candidatus Binatia bacterium]
MERRQLGRTDMKVSVLGFGGSEIGYQNATEKTVSRLLNQALDAGLNVIDTAECYLKSEELIGQTIAFRRKDYYLFTKCGHPKRWGLEDWRPSSILQSMERSLSRLRTDYVDLIQLHSCSEAELRNGFAIEALQEARARGYTRYIGYSGDDPAARYAIECGQFDTLQTSVNIADQGALDVTLPLASERNVGVIAKRPLANVAWRTGRMPTDPYHHVYWERLRKLNYDFLHHKLKEAVATALRFTLSVPGVQTVIVGTTKPGRWSENAALLEAGLLSSEEIKSIRGRWREAAEPTWMGQR